MKPESPLSVFKGSSPPTGIWTLIVNDDFSSEVSSGLTKLNDWILDIYCNIPRVFIKKVSDGAEPNTNGQFKISLTSNDGINTPITGTVPVTGNLLYTASAIKGLIILRQTHSQFPVAQRR